MSVKANALVLGVMLRGGEEEQRFTAATALRLPRHAALTSVCMRPLLTK